MPMIFAALELHRKEWQWPVLEGWFALAGGCLSGKGISWQRLRADVLLLSFNLVYRDTEESLFVE